MTIGEALKQVRLHEGLTQEQMAAGIISESFYSKVERDVHQIDANLLLDILVAHHIDVGSFFSKISNQKTKQEPDFDLMNQISFAQNKRDLHKLDEITEEIKNRKEKPSFWLQFRLENAYAWTLHSGDQIDPELKKKVKAIIVDENWNRTAYHYLSQAVIFLDIDDAYQLVNSAFRAYKKRPATDTFTLQFVAMIAVNFLNCCYHKHASKKYAELAIQFLRELPMDGAIGINSVLGTYYEALFNSDRATADEVADVLRKSGYVSLIEDTLK
ncbi:helix-turn-helix domain-containing protein [Lactobacillus ultunensis]|uniref:helix-turn-helix domain-containing protein n=1 Tax=Lactobacillus ultunensis TaxID=227945 RepID=UPI00031D4037|nr:helix-turn-helix transcriptional regulator [Lactobacillus ultunensis]QQP27902.1 helix-turn-helix transcriptional regulator [Lactobacillus ultunensis]